MCKKLRIYINIFLNNQQRKNAAKMVHNAQAWLNLHRGHTRQLTTSATRYLRILDIVVVYLNILYKNKYLMLLLYLMSLMLLMLNVVDEREINKK